MYRIYSETEWVMLIKNIYLGAVTLCFLFVKSKFNELLLNQTENNLK